MSHIVIHTSAGGATNFTPCADLEQAVKAVERLRNEGGVEEIRLYRLDEVRFEFKPTYKVELAGAGASMAPPGPAAAPSMPPPLTPPPLVQPAAAPPPVVNAPPAAAPSPAASTPPMPPVSPPSASPAPPGPAAAPPQAAPPREEDDGGMTARRGLFGR